MHRQQSYEQSGPHPSQMLLLIELSKAVRSIPAGCTRPQEHKYCDSLDPRKEFSKISYQELRSPQPGDEGWPRMQVMNVLFNKSNRIHHNF